MVAVTETESQELGDTSGTAAGLLGRACVTYWREVGPAGIVCGLPVCALQGPGNVGWQPERVDQHSQALSPGPEESGAEPGGAGPRRTGWFGPGGRQGARTAFFDRALARAAGDSLARVGPGTAAGARVPIRLGPVLAGVGRDLGFLLSAVGLGTLLFFFSFTFFFFFFFPPLPLSLPAPGGPEGAVTRLPTPRSLGGVTVFV